MRADRIGRAARLVHGKSIPGNTTRVGKTTAAIRTILLLDTGELRARIRVCLRRCLRADGEIAEAVFTTGGLRVDLEKRQVFVEEVEVHLTPIEYRLLGEMIRHAGKVLTHNHLLKAVWGPLREDESHYLRVFVGQLRKKLESETARPKYLLTEPGVGYRLKAD